MSTEKTIIFVDDEEQILKSIYRSLRQEPYTLLTTIKPDEALKWIKEKDVQVIVSDYRMYNTTGIDLLKKVKEIKPHVVRAILSGYADQEVIVSALKSGDVYRYFLKPWDIEEMKKEINGLFSYYDSTLSGGVK